MRISRMNRIARLRLMVAMSVAVTLGACTVAKDSAPSLAGPSGFGTSFTIAANPTVLPRDGSTQTTITVVARDESGQPKPNLPLDVAVSPSTAVVALDAQTRSDGSARFLVTAPRPEVVAPQDNTVVLWVLPQGEAIGNDFQNARAQSVRVNLSGARNATYPSPTFTISPEAPIAPAYVVFDASGTTDEGVQCFSCTYSWATSHGYVASGVVAAFPFSLPGTYAVVLTVTDITGTVNSTARSVEVKPEEEEEDPMP